MSNFPKTAKETIIAFIPDYLIQQRDGGGGKKLSYLSGSTVTDILNKAFDYQWDWIVDKEWIQESQDKFNKWSKVPDAEKVTVNGERGAWEKQAPVAHVRCTLTAYYTDANNNRVSISKTGYGSKVIMGGASDQESIFKAAGTDALKKAASLLGIGLQLYRNEEEAYYFFNELNYENPWTEEALTAHADNRNYISNLMQEKGLDEAAMVQVLQEFDESFEALSQVIPDNIEAVVSFLKAKVAAASEKKKIAPAKKA